MYNNVIIITLDNFTTIGYIDIVERQYNRTKEATMNPRLSNDYNGGYRNKPEVKAFTCFLVGRPVRDTPISAEDITDLKIALYTSKSLTEFLSKV